MVLRAFLFASAFILISCADTEFNNPDDPNSKNYNEGGDESSSSGADIAGSSSSVLGSSSSSNLGSSSSIDVGPVFYEGKTYNTVLIGEQIWMTENLNYNVSGSKCYSNNDVNCNKYGKLYTWAMAMNLPSSCNSASCSDQVVSNHKGICPSGWHIPSREDWTTLKNYVEKQKSCTNCTGKYLKAITGWNSSGNGQDAYGFSALPGGYEGSGAFGFIGQTGAWWAALEHSADTAFTQTMLYNGDSLIPRISPKSTYYHSVRCLKDMPLPSSSSTTCGTYNASTQYCSNGVVKSYGSIADDGGKTYKTVVIGEQTWMAENLNYNAAGSKCYNSSDANCNKYGRLYDWTTAMALPSSCNSEFCAEQIGGNHKGICPSDWHIPTYADFQALRIYVENQKSCTQCAGKYLKTKNDWTNTWDSNGNGEDAFGFAALPGGFANPDGTFAQINLYARWWLATESSELADRAQLQRMVYTNDSIGYYRDVKTILYGIRCLKNMPLQSSSSVAQSSSSATLSSSSIAPSSSSIAASSSSIAASSSSVEQICNLNSAGTICLCGNSVYSKSTQYCSNGTIKDYGSVTDGGGKTYKTVVIGGQKWMAENLSYNASGSKCPGGSDANCDKYGRLYTWATAMNLSSSCNSASCSGQIGSNHKGVCPANWHVPSNAEWLTLVNYVEGQKSCSDCAGKYLKATDGWDGSGNGENAFGFSALPGGYGYSGGGFSGIGTEGDWWTASEYSTEDARMLDMTHNSNSVGRYYDDKPLFFSIRCIEDTATEYTGGSCDIADYGTVSIGDQVWMAKNYGCYVPNSKCYGNDPANCAKYGRLYDWATAMALTPNCNSTSCTSQITAKHKGICPTGWHIPTDAEWGTLMLTVDPNYLTSSDNVGWHLKASSGWNGGGNGNNTYGFAALPGGYYDADDEEYSKVNTDGYWWSATAKDWEIAYGRYSSYNSDEFFWGHQYKDYSLSVRCIKD